MTARRALAHVNVAAIERNCVRLRGELRGGTELCAVVKADGYGHGAAPSARAALAGGASWLAVASASEARELREAGLHEARVLAMGALSEVELGEALAADADVVVWNERQVEAVRAAGGGRVHVKLDSGMGRLGTRDPAEAARVVAAVRYTAGVELAGVMTHFATADDPDDDGFFVRQLAVFADWAREVKRDHPEIVVHAANSAALLRDERASFDMVRCGIAVYGMDPFGEDPSLRALEPALELSSYVAAVKPCRTGDSAGYGRRFVAARDTHLGVLPIGYGDGFRRGCSNNADVLIGGRRYPLVGTVSMDNVTVDLGPDPAAAKLLGEEAILIGTAAADPGLRAVPSGAVSPGILSPRAVSPGGQGVERITAEDLARRLDTINYEVTCALTPRVPRIYHRDGRPIEPDAGARASTSAARGPSALDGLEAQDGQNAQDGSEAQDGSQAEARAGSDAR